jgi:large subunit ribosomal protein L20
LFALIAHTGRASESMRAKSGAARNKAKKRIFHASKGFVGGRRRLLRLAKETLVRAGLFAFRDRRAKKRAFRRLFITRLTAAAEMRGLRYSRLIHGLRLAKIGLDRKSLSELAIHDPETFDAIIAKVRIENDKHDAEVLARQKAKTA